MSLRPESLLLDSLKQKSMSKKTLLCRIYASDISSEVLRSLIPEINKTFLQGFPMLGRPLLLKQKIKYKIKPLTSCHLPIKSVYVFLSSKNVERFRNWLKSLLPLFLVNNKHRERYPLLSPCLVCRSC